MNLTELHRKLIAAAQSAPANDRVPYAFEKRIMATLSGKTTLDSWGLWGRALCRAAVCCVVFMLLLGVGFHFLPATNPQSLSQDLDQTLFAAVDGNSDSAGDLR
jgi:hypothetical protein